MPQWPAHWTDSLPGPSWTSACKTSWRKLMISLTNWVDWRESRAPSSSETSWKPEWDTFSPLRSTGASWTILGNFPNKHKSCMCSLCFLVLTMRVAVISACQTWRDQLISSSTRPVNCLYCKELASQSQSHLVFWVITYIPPVSQNIHHIALPS